jgi:hypothetical protein
MMGAIYSSRSRGALTFAPTSLCTTWLQLDFPGEHYEKFYQCDRGVDDDVGIVCNLSKVSELNEAERCLSA